MYQRYFQNLTKQAYMNNKATDETAQKVQSDQHFYCSFTLHIY